jgi:hypothetical protein
VSVQDRCTVCTKRTIDLEIVLDAPDGTPRCALNVSDAQKSFWTHSMKVPGDGAQVESHFQSIWREC